MASASSSLHISMAISVPSTSYTVNHRLRLMPAALKPQQLSSSRCSVVTCARRRTNTSSSSVASSKKKKQGLGRNNVGKEEGVDVDAFEALFKQLEEDLRNDVSFDDDLEEDLKNDGSFDNDDDDDNDDGINEEDLVNLEQELEEAAGDDELLGLFDGTLDESSEKEFISNEVIESTTADAAEREIEGSNQEEEEEDEEEDDEGYDEGEGEDEEPLELKRWQLRRLAYALKEGRRKTRIKNLAADLCLDRAVVLELLRDPPPVLLMLSATLPDKPVTTVLEPKIKPEDAVLLKRETEPRIRATAEVPVHEMQRSWSAQKRLKKVQVETLQRVYRRSKRPSNAMIDNIVHVTNIPRKKVLKWFEDKRTEDGVPDHRSPYRRSASESVSIS